MELLLVTAIIGILLTATVPSMMRSIRGSRLRAGASAVAKAGKYARSMAIMSQQEVRLTFRKADARIEASGGGGRARLDRAMDGVRIENVEIDSQAPQTEADTWTVSYMRNGRCTPYSVTLANSRDEAVTIRVNAFGEARTKDGA